LPFIVRLEIFALSRAAKRPKRPDKNASSRFRGSSLPCGVARTVPLVSQASRITDQSLPWGLRESRSHSVTRTMSVPPDRTVWRRASIPGRSEIVEPEIPSSENSATIFRPWDFAYRLRDRFWSGRLRPSRAWRSVDTR
jgi:hypothetical protein